MRIQARPFKLLDGSWGAAIQNDDIPEQVTVEAGLEIEVVARSGKSWGSQVEALEFTGEDYFLVRIGRPGFNSRPSFSSRSRQRTITCGCCGASIDPRTGSEVKAVPTSQ